MANTTYIKLTIKGFTLCTILLVVFHTDHNWHISTHFRAIPVVYLAGGMGHLEMT